MRISDWSSDVCSSDLLDVKAGFDGARAVGDIKKKDGDRRRDPARKTAARQVMAAHQQIDREHQDYGEADRKSVVQGKSVSVRVDLGGRRITTIKPINIIS